MQNNSLTICIPTYNRLSSLKITINSILKLQDYYGTTFDVLISDNCSTDGTPDYIKNLDLPNIHYILNTKNTSMYENHNTLAQNTTTNWLMFLHDDDELISDPLRIISECNASAKDSLIIPQRPIYPDYKDPYFSLSGDLGIAFFLLWPSAIPSGSIYNTSLLKASPFNDKTLISDLLYIINTLKLDNSVIITKKSSVKINKGKHQASFHVKKSSGYPLLIRENLCNDYFKIKWKKYLPYVQKLKKYDILRQFKIAFPSILVFNFSILFCYWLISKIKKFRG